MRYPQPVTATNIDAETKHAETVDPTQTASTHAKQKDDHDAKLPTEEKQEMCVADSFDAMRLREEFLRGIFSYGFETPSVIQ